MRIYVSVSPSEHRQFKQAAEEAGMTLTDWMAKAAHSVLEDKVATEPAPMDHDPAEVSPPRHTTLAETPKSVDPIPTHGLPTPSVFPHRAS